ncbi:MAG: DUF4411 family protein [Rhodococcus sp. (in: high G+C Gram-positive bacteria)]
MAYLLDTNAFIEAKKRWYGTDAYLVAHAHAHGYVVVTHERVSNSLKNVKIPNACIAMGVKYLNPFEMLRAEKARFILGTRS